MTDIARFQIDQTIVIDGVTYRVVWFQTLADVEAKYPHTAADWVRCSIKAELVIQRPKGRRQFHTFYYADERGSFFRTPNQLPTLGMR